MQKSFSIIKNAKKLRNLPTIAESKLWYQLRRKQFKNYKFRRQQPIDNYIADFVCLEKRLVIELDGGQHGFIKGKEYDYKRTQDIEKQGFKVIRFWNNEVLENMEGVMTEIAKYLETPLPSPPREGEGKVRAIPREGKGKGYGDFYG